MSEKDLQGSNFSAKGYSFRFYNGSDTFAFFEDGELARHIPFSVESGLLIINHEDFKIVSADRRNIKVLYKGKLLSLDRS